MRGNLLTAALRPRGRTIAAHPLPESIRDRLREAQDRTTRRRERGSASSPTRALLTTSCQVVYAVNRRWI